MSAFHNNLALHISEATLKARRRLAQPEPSSWGYVISSCLGACLGAGCIWAVAMVLL
jgi:hypothetical protein